MIQRYFLEVCYKGTAYAGFQVQHNARTVQGEMERALEIFLRRKVALTGSSRTDSGVHAKQNYFHFDYEGIFEKAWAYNINAILPADIAINSIKRVSSTAHCRFDATYREYRYLVYTRKDPFVAEQGYFFPYRVDYGAMSEAAETIKEYEDFEAFSKRNTQVKTFRCRVIESRWEECDGYYTYTVRANRFLRGMVRGLVGTMLQVGRGRMGLDEFTTILKGTGELRADFAVPGGGLCLVEVGFREGYFDGDEG
jgi:tRNA pseudouridine38-40 synthase